MSNRRIIASVSILALVTVLLVATLPETRGAQFALAEWDFPDEYGQGIVGLRVYENSTGSWVHYYFCQYDDTNDTYEWEIDVGIKITAWTYINTTLAGFSTIDEGKNYQQHNVTVVNRNGATVFSQQNFTYTGATNTTYPENDVWVYFYEVILEFTPIYAEVYTVTVVYEVFW